MLRGPVLASPAESSGALVVVLAVGSEWFAVHDPPQGGHPGCPPLHLDPAYARVPVGTGPDQGTGLYLFQTQTLRSENRLARSKLASFGFFMADSDRFPLKL